MAHRSHGMRTDYTDDIDVISEGSHRHNHPRHQTLEEDAPGHKSASPRTHQAGNHHAHAGGHAQDDQHLAPSTFRERGQSPRHDRGQSPRASPRSAGGRSGSRSPYHGGPRRRSREELARQDESQRNGRTDRQWLADIALREMKAHDFRVDFTESELRELRDIEAAFARESASSEYPTIEDLPWVSIDNDDTRDIDQITAAIEREDGSIVLYVGIADVDAVIRPDGEINRRAMANTTSIYTPATVFTMLPEKLCFDLTSLLPNAPRRCVVFKITYTDITATQIVSESIFLATLVNQAKLAYNGVSAWLNGGAMPAPLEGREDLQKAVILQDKLTASLLAIRRQNGTLEFDRPETNVIFDAAGKIVALQPSIHSRSSELIENVMIAANGAMSRYIAAHGFASVQRVLPKSEHWDEIVALAKGLHEHLPSAPSSLPLRQFLAKARAKLPDSEQYRDLCLSVIKLLGRGEYIATTPGEEPVGHFALAVNEYSHSTAPNRRYPDVIVHRILKAALKGRPSPYTKEQLDSLAQHCSEREAVSSKLERQVRKAAACIVLADHIGEKCEAFVTGNTDKGIYARFMIDGVLAEGRVVHTDRAQHYKVGEKFMAELVDLDVDQGHIDLADLRARTPSHSARDTPADD